jgi:hypothetical protein
MKKEKCKALIEMFQKTFKLLPSLVIEDEFGCTASASIKHKNAKITLEVSELIEEEAETPTQIPSVEFHELRVKDGTSHYIITFYLENDAAGKCAVRVYIE